MSLISAIGHNGANGHRDSKSRFMISATFQSSRNFLSKKSSLMASFRTLIVMQPTPFCNIDCGYCYLPNRSSNHKMEMDVLGKIVMEVFSSKLVSPPIDFLWHLGEPLAVPISFYEQAFSIIHQIGQDRGAEYSLSFQTNAMLINQNWIELIKNNKINIGVSIDGPDFIHDRKRVDRKSNGTHAQVMKGVKMLQDANIPFSTIMVVTKNSLDYPDEICDFFIKNGIDEIGFNIDEVEGSNHSTSFDNVDSIKFRHFIQRMLKRSVESNGQFRVREFWLNIRPFTTDVTEPFNTTNAPFRIFNFDCHGNYSTYCPELLAAKSEEYNNFNLGNIVKDGLDAIERNPTFLRMKDEIDKGVENCKNSCEYWSFCGGGAPSNKFFENGSFSTTETLACKYQKKEVVDLLASHFEQQLSVQYSK